jgi:hypothetical protein
VESLLAGLASAQLRPAQRLLLFAAGGCYGMGVSAELIAIIVTTTIQVAIAVLGFRSLARIMQDMEESRSEFEAVLFGTTKDIWEFVQKLRPNFKH